MNTEKLLVGDTPRGGKRTAGKTLKILVAEDDPHDQMLLVMAARDCEADLEMDFVDDGREMLEELHRRSLSGPMPDLIILDMRMPRLDGHEVLQALSDTPPVGDIEVGVFSSSYRQRDIERSLDLGAAWHEVKPSRYEDLVDFVERVTKGRDGA